MVCAHTTINLFLSPCTFYKVNMLLLYYIILLILKSFMTFSVSHDYVTCDCDICNHSVTSVIYDFFFFFYINNLLHGARRQAMVATFVATYMNVHETGYNMKERKKRKREKEKKKEERERLTKRQVDMKTKELRELNRD